jgi:hypothetical protein
MVSHLLSIIFYPLGTTFDIAYLEDFTDAVSRRFSEWFGYIQGGFQKEGRAGNGVGECQGFGTQELTAKSSDLGECLGSFTAILGVA